MSKDKKLRLAIAGADDPSYALSPEAKVASQKMTDGMLACAEVLSTMPAEQARQGAMLVGKYLVLVAANRSAELECKPFGGNDGNA